MRHLFAVIVIVSIVAPAAAAPDSLFEVTKLTRNLHVLSTDQGENTTNTLVFFGDGGLVLVDTQDESEAGELKEVVDSYGKGTPKYIINTHRHVEHIGGNAIFGNDPIVIALELVPSKLKSGSYIFAEYPPATYPDITVTDKYTLEFNGEPIEVIAMGGSHDDNEVIVYFTKSKVVHLSSLVNGFNFPSVDRDGDVLMFAPLVAQAIAMLPKDVVIVSGHNRTGTWDDLRAYHEMLVQTTEVVRKGLAEGKDLATLQEEEVLAEWESSAGSYVSAGDWIEYLAERILNGKDDRPTPHVPMYHAWKEQDAAAAIELFRGLRRDHVDEYYLSEFVLFSIGDKLYKRVFLEDAALFLEASLEDYPQGKYNYYIHYELADINRQLGNEKPAIRHCERSLELNPDFDAAKMLLEELGKK